MVYIANISYPRLYLSSTLQMFLVWQN